MPKRNFRSAQPKFKAMGVVLFFSGLAAAEPNRPTLKGRLLRLERASPLYEKASQKSRVVGEADAGTIVDVVDESPQGLWLKVKDVDHNTAWIPKVVTDAKSSGFKDPEPPPMQQSIQPIRESFSSDKNRNKSPTLLPTEIFNLGPSLRLAYSDPHKKNFWGIRSQILSENSRTSKSSEYYGVQLGFDYHPTYQRENKKVSALGIPLRLQGLTLGNSGFVRGPDAGIFLTRTRMGSAQSFVLSASAGYSLGYLAPKSRYFFSLRSGYEFFVTHRISFEFSTGLIL